MRVIMVMFDSLNRKFLSSYGCEQSVTPNFQRLSELTVTFDNFYGGSLPLYSRPPGAADGQIQFST